MSGVDDLRVGLGGRSYCKISDEGRSSTGITTDEGENQPGSLGNVDIVQNGDENQQNPCEARNYAQTKNQEDVDEAIALAREVGSDISIEENGGYTQISIATPRGMSLHHLDNAMDTDDTETFGLETEVISHLSSMSDEDLYLLSGMYEEPPNDNQIGLYIYACFLIFTRKDSVEHLRRAARLNTGWMAGLDLDDPNRTRGVKIATMISLRARHLDYAVDPRDEYRGNLLVINDELDDMIGRAALTFLRYRQTGVQRELDEAIRMTEKALEISPRTSALSNFATILGARFEQSGSINDLNRIVDALKKLVNGTPQDHPKRNERLSTLGKRLGEQYDRTNLLDILVQSIDALNIAVEATPSQDHELQLFQLTCLGLRLINLYQRTGSMDDLNRLISIIVSVLDKMPEDYPIRNGWVNNLGVYLGFRFERTDSIDDLNLAIEILDNAASRMAHDDASRSAIFNTLGLRLCSRFDRLDSIGDLDRGISMLQMAVDSTSQDDLTDLATRMSNLGAQFGNRFHRTGVLKDLDDAIDTSKMAMNLVLPNSDCYVTVANNLANFAGISYEHTNSRDDLDDTIGTLKALIEDPLLQDHPARAKILGTLGSRLNDRYYLTDALDDLNSAINLTTMAADATPGGYEKKSEAPYSYGRAFQYQKTGSIDDLHYAIEISNKAISLTPQDRPSYATSLQNFGRLLGYRFERTGLMNDIDRAIAVSDDAVNATPESNLQERAGRLDNLGTLLGLRSQRAGSVSDLNRAIDIGEQALNIIPQDSVERPNLLGNLGAYYMSRFEVPDLASVDDANRGIELARIALDSTPPDHFFRVSRLANLGNCRGRRYLRTGLVEDLHAAVELLRAAISITPSGHPDRITGLHSLGIWLTHQYRKTKSPNDLESMISHYMEGWEDRGAAPRDRIRIALKACEVLASQLEWEKASQVIEAAVNLLPAVNARWLQHTDKQHLITGFAGLAAMGAAVFLNAGREVHEALRILELGRGIVAGILMDMRVDISDLRRAYPNLADEFESLRDTLDTPTVTPNNDMSTWEVQAKEHREADDRFNKLIDEIRAKPEFVNFLLPPDQKELIAMANPDPIIVVNLSHYRCDAFIIERNQLRVLELPSLKRRDVEKWVTNLQSSQAANIPMGEMLKWLWDVVCHPCLDSLGFRESNSRSPPRVWWIPTGLLSQLPLHAAGVHTSGSNETVLDRVVSSYASSIKALIHGRRLNNKGTVKPSCDYALLVAMRETPDLVRNGLLPHALQEVEMLSGLCSELQLQPIRPVLRKANVLDHLGKCRLFHFAGHGESDPREPSRSRLLLEDWTSDPLTVGDLRDLRLHESKTPPFLSYLSACSTGSNQAFRLADEGIHLISAFQLAGFRHVVGTLWEVVDMHCIDVAKVLYETMRDEGMTDTAVAQGLHRAVKMLRDAAIKEGRNRNATWEDSDTEEAEMEPSMSNFYWVPYIHFGV
ncbi:CHAT domain-containing protein [Xylaria arbuscula]|nr:CHAT domain-containing protein [Xylaria arbuscula]